MTGTELHRWRTEIAGVTQGELATLLGLSQKSVSVYENSQSRKVPKAVVAQIEKLGDNPKSAWPAASSSTQAFCWPEQTYGYIWENAPRRAEKVKLTATYTAVPGEARADCALQISFSKLELRGRDFLCDHIGPLVFDETKSEAGWNVGRGLNGLQKATYRFTTVIEETPEEFRENLAENRPRRGLSYKIQQDSPATETNIFLRTTEPLAVNQRDLVGYPIYSDFAVRELTVEIRLEGLRIERYGSQNKLDAEPRALTIRRTQFNDEPGMTAPLGPQEELATRMEHDTQVVTLGPLHRPRGGYMYSIRWSQMQPTK